MDGILSTLGPIPSESWGVFAFNAVMVMILAIHPHVHHAFHQRRLDRRLAQDSFIHRDELREYKLAIGEELEPLRPWDVVKQALLAGACGGIPMWLAKSHLEHWWEYGWLALAVVELTYSLWRRLNDPETDHEPLTIFGDEISSISVAGLVGAVGIVGLLLFLATRFF